MVIILNFYNSRTKMVKAIDNIDIRSINEVLANCDRDGFFCLGSHINTDEYYELYDCCELDDYLFDNDIDENNFDLNDKENQEKLKDTFESIGYFYITEYYAEEY